MKALVRAILLVPLGIILIGFALANHDSVTVRLDPLGVIDPPLTYQIPLFLPIFIAIMIGILIGGTATWFSAGRHRRAARVYLRDLERQRRENDELKRERELQPLPPATLIG